MSFDNRALLIATIVGTVLQVAMVVIGHSNKTVAALFAIGGMGFSLIAGVIYSVMAQPTGVVPALSAGAIAGGVCALIGIFVSYLLKDVPASLLLLGTISSVVTGAIGGWLGRLVSNTT